MKKFILNLIFILLVSIWGYSQTGQGYLNYISYKTHNGNGSTNQYPAIPNTTEEFTNLLDISNSNTTITHQGTWLASNSFNTNQRPPRWSGDFYAFRITGYFQPTETGTYTFIFGRADDAAEILINDTFFVKRSSTNTIDVVAGLSYKIEIRFQEFGGADYYSITWKTPSNQTATTPDGQQFWSYDPNPNQVLPLHYDVNFKFGNGIDPSTFSLNTFHRVSPQEVSQNSNSNTIGLDVNGEATITSQIDETLTADGTNKIVALAGVNGIAAVISPSGFGPNATRFYIDNRMFDSGFDFSTVTHIEMLDLYSGPLEFQNTDPSSIWQFYKISGYEPDRVQMSQVSNWRNADGGGYTGPGVVYEMNPQNNYPLPDFVITNDWEVQPNQGYKEQYVIFEPIPNLQTIVDGIITVSDVYSAFTELSGGGLLGGFAGNYEYGIQYSNSDINRDGVFDFNDTFIMLDYLNGGTLFDTSYLAGVIKLIQTDEYNSISSTNWNGYTTQTMYPLNLNTTDKLYDINVSVSWLGDVNLSHSPLPTNNLSITGKSPIRKTINKIEGDIEIEFNSEIIGENLVVTLKLNPMTEQVVGTQFRINYDSDKLSYTTTEFTNTKINNFHTNRGNFINLGSISTDGSITLDSTTEYTLTFKTKEVKSGLGLVSITPIDAVNKDGTQLKMVIK